MLSVLSTATVTVLQRLDACMLAACVLMVAADAKQVGPSGFASVLACMLGAATPSQQALHAWAVDGATCEAHHTDNLFGHCHACALGTVLTVKRRVLP
jgi:hypothetical protein